MHAAKFPAMAAWLALSVVGLARAEPAAPNPEFRNGRSFGEMSGFEGNEQALGAAVAKAIMEASPTKGPEHDFSGREQVLGQAVATAIRTLNVKKPYQHEMNDALVKMTLDYIQFAKDHKLMDELIDHELKVQSPMLIRNAKKIKESGNQEIALIALTDRTACFYQLALEVKREPGKISYKSPFGTVLAVTRQIGQHDLTEKEIHETWTVPRLKRQAQLMGVDIQVSEWRDDGWITISLPEQARVAATN